MNESYLVLPSETESVTKSTVDLSNFKKVNTSAVTLVIECVNNKTGDTEFHEYINRMCFGFTAGLSPYKKGETHTPVNLYYRLARKRDKDTFVDDWHRWIFSSSTSPWKILLKDGVTYQLQTDAKSTPHIKLPITNETPAQVLVSFLIACRAGWDEPHLIRMFLDLKEKGWDDTLALYTAIYLGKEEDGRTVDNWASGGYYTFSPKATNVYKWLKDKTPKYDEKNTFGMRYKGIQDMWYEVKPDYYTKGGFYKLIANSKMYEGAFPKNYLGNFKTLQMPLTKMPSFDDLLKQKDLILEKVAA